MHLYLNISINYATESLNCFFHKYIKPMICIVSNKLCNKLS